MSEASTTPPAQQEKLDSEKVKSEEIAPAAAEKKAGRFDAADVSMRIVQEQTATVRQEEG